MTVHHVSRTGLRLLFITCVCLVAAPLIGCGAKEEPQAPGYYTGPMQGKNQAPAAGGTAAPAKGKASND